MARLIGEYVKCSQCEEITPQEDWGEVDPSDAEDDAIEEFLADIGGPDMELHECPACGGHEYIQNWDF